MRGKRGQNVSGVVGVYYDDDPTYTGTKRWRIDVMRDSVRYRRRCSTLDEAREHLQTMGYQGA